MFGADSGFLSDVDSMVDGPGNASNGSLPQPFDGRRPPSDDEDMLFFGKRMGVFYCCLGKFQSAFVHNVASIRIIWGKCDIMWYNRYLKNSMDSWVEQYEGRKDLMKW